MCAAARFAPRPRIQAGGITFAAALESVLVGHEDWVHAVAWQPLPRPPPEAQSLPSSDRGRAGDGGVGGSCGEGSGEGRSGDRPCLLSASMDRTMMLWRPDAATGVTLQSCGPGPPVDAP